MEYPEGCSTAMRHVARKVAAMEGGLVYDSIPSLGLSLQSPIEFIQSPIGFIQESHDGT